MALSKVSSLNSLFNTIFEDAIFVAREQNLMAALVTPFSDNTFADRQMGIYPQLTAQVVTEGVDYANPIEWTKTSTMTISPKRIQVQVTLTDERIMTDPDDARRDAAREMGGAIASKIDTDLVAEFVNFTAVKGAAGSALSIEVVAAGMSVLRAAFAPNPLWVVVHPNQWFDVWAELGAPALTASFLGDVANEALRNYFVGDWIGATWFTSGNIAVNATTDDASGGVFHREALALDTRTPLTMEVERDASLQGFEINAVARYGTSVRRDTFGVEILSDATAPDGFGA